MFGDSNGNDHNTPDSADSATSNSLRNRHSAPAFTSANAATFTAGISSSFNVTATGSPPPKLTGNGVLPNGVSFDDATGLLSGTPLPGTAGTYDLTFGATNGVKPNVIQSFVLTVNQAPAFTSSNAATFTVGVNGSFTVTASGFPTPTLGESGTLPAGLSFNPATGALSGTPQAGTGGSYPLVFTASNGVGTAATQQFTLLVDTAPKITSANTTTFTVGTPGSFTVTATGMPAPSLQGNGLLPNGVVFDDATGLLSGTPLPGTGGTYELTFAALNGVSPDAIQSFILAVDAAPAIVSANSTTFTVGAFGTFSVAAHGFPAPTFTESGTLPNGLSFNPSTGLLSGTPQLGTGGVYPIDLTATNGVGSPATQAFTLVVDAAPAITSANATTFTAGTNGSFTVTASGLPSPTFSESGALPNGVSFSDATGLLSGTPSTGSGGTYDLTFTASNGVSPNATQSFILTVDERPTITSADGTTFTVGTSGSFTVTANGFPTPTFVQSGPLPSGVNFNSTSGVLSGTPQPGTGGTYVLAITPTNIVGPGGTQTFMLIVDQAPAFTSPSGTVFTVGTLGTFNVTTSGTPAAALSETGTLPTGVTFNTATGTLTGTPQAGTGGTYDLTFTASNGITPNASQSFVLTVDQAPAITSASGAFFTAGVPNTFTVTASGFPAPTFVEIGLLPDGVTFSNAGVLSGTPIAALPGTFLLTFSAANGVGLSGGQNFTLTVVTAPAITSANSATFVVGSAGSFSVTVTGSPTPTLSESGALPNGLSFNTGTDSITGTPATGTGGTYPLTFTASNGISANATQNFTLIVDEAPAITSTNTATFKVGTAGSFALTATGFPAPTFNEAGTLPSGLGFSPTGVLSGTPLPGTGGTFSVTFTPVNSVGVGLGQIFTIIVEQAPAITSPANTTFTVGTPESFTVIADGFPTPSFAETGALPSGVSFNTTNGLLSGTPLPGSGGIYPLTFTAMNAAATGPSQAFSLVVDETPAITSVNTATFVVGSAGSFALTATGFPAPTFNEAGTLPSGLGFSPTGVLSGTPLPGTGGTYSVTFTPINSVGVGLGQIFTIVVDQAPAITSANTTVFNVGAFGTFAVTASGFPAPAFSETGALPTGVSFNPVSGLFSGTPQTGTGGSYSLTITASNGVSPNASEAFTLVVDEVPQISSPNSATFTVGTNGSFTVTANGFPASTFSESGPLPNGLSFDTATGVLTGTPLANTGGTYTLHFTATNAAGAGPAQTFTLIVLQDPAITSANNATFPVGSFASFNVTATGFPAPTFAETGVLPSGLTFDSTTGVLSGTANAGTAGTYSITFIAMNGVDTEVMQTFTLTVST
jgi:hypothetical protein